MPKPKWIDVHVSQPAPDGAEIVHIALDRDTAHAVALFLPTTGPVALVRAHLDAKLIGLPGAVRYVAERPSAADARLARRRQYAEIMMEESK